MPAGASRAARVFSISTNCCGSARHSADNERNGVRASLCICSRKPASSGACLPPATARIAPKPCASSFSVQRACPPSMRGSSGTPFHTSKYTVPSVWAMAICSPATSCSLRFTIVHSAWPAPGKRLANTPACSVFSYGVQSALTMSGANCRWIVAIRRSVSASRGVS